MRICKSVALLFIAVNAALIVAFVLVVMRWPRHVHVPSEQPAAEFRILPRMSVMAPAPDWNRLDPYQGTLTREQFEKALTEVFSSGDAWKAAIELSDSHATVSSQNEEGFELRFANTAISKPPPRYWRSATALPKLSDKTKPLQSMRIVIDPGHIGGDWAKTEQRWYSIEEGVEIMEGNMTLQVAKILKPKLKSLGAQVFLTRTETQPVTDLRPKDFEQTAADHLRSTGTNPDSNPKTLKFERDRLFYRKQEIRTRAWLINDVYQPDLVLCLHFNAEGWGNPRKPTFVSANHLHLLINGTYSMSEVRLHDQCFEMLLRILQRTHQEELAISTTMATAMAEATGLPAFKYGGSNARQVGKSDYVFARNLLATRLYQCPVVFFEPYVMNNRLVHDRIREGDYLGERTINGVRCKSIFREYADGVVEGLKRHYLQARRR